MDESSSPILIADLDAIIEESLQSFYDDISSLECCGREREMVSRFVFGHLARHCHPNGPLSLTQLGIEVAVRQLPPNAQHPRRKKAVCKDLVVWGKPNTIVWGPDRKLCHEPLAVMEWKVNHHFNRSIHGKNRHEHELDIQWLQDTSNRLGATDFVGYAVLVDSTSTPKELSCVRIWSGKKTTPFRPRSRGLLALSAIVGGG